MRTVDFGAAEDCSRPGQPVDRGQTHDRIPEILPEGTIDPLTRLVLVNALYFKAPWRSPFEKSATSPGPFHRPDGSVVQAS